MVISENENNFLNRSKVENPVDNTVIIEEKAKIQKSFSQEELDRILSNPQAEINYERKIIYNIKNPKQEELEQLQKDNENLKKQLDEKNVKVKPKQTKPQIKAIKNATVKPIVKTPPKGKDVHTTVPETKKVKHLEEPKKPEQSEGDFWKIKYEKLKEEFDLLNKNFEDLKKQNDIIINDNKHLLNENEHLKKEISRIKNEEKKSSDVKNAQAAEERRRKDSNKTKLKHPVAKKENDGKENRLTTSQIYLDSPEYDDEFYGDFPVRHYYRDDSKLYVDKSKYEVLEKNYEELKKKYENLNKDFSNQKDQLKLLQFKYNANKDVNLNNFSQKRMVDNYELNGIKKHNADLLKSNETLKKSNSDNEEKINSLRNEINDLEIYIKK